MPHLSSHPFTARPAPLHRGPTRPRRQFLATLGAIVDSAFSPGAAAAHGTPALQAREAQERLAALGFLPADALTGRYDRATMDAVARFQASEGLPVDGIPDAATADALLRE
ncbi:peptidoglycan-binding domain-containing protein [Solirubrobacter soli]|uniref:peptidoglycan-binding domain-containing protein n=1 Tax=Solirubrobacter soli TaxID=363832 RepID=UPI00040341AD|nr:peptidoglycan-binding domain-containing protein [Solirubrobacter soli]